MASLQIPRGGQNCLPNVAFLCRLANPESVLIGSLTRGDMPICLDTHDRVPGHTCASECCHVALSLHGQSSLDNVKISIRNHT